MSKKKNAVMIADTRSALVGHILLQLQETNKGLFDEAIIYYTELSGNDMGIMNSIMPCRFIKYSPALPDELLEKERFKMFSVIMFARYEMFKYLQEFETITWIDTDILIQGKLDGLIKEADQTGFALIREDYENKTAKEPDHMRTCFTQSVSGYNMEAYLYCSGTVVLTDKLIIKSDYTDWCYNKTIEWSDILSLPDQGVLNALVQEFGLSVSPLNGGKYCCFPYYGRDCSQAKIVHAWGGNKFWCDWYLYTRFTLWKDIYNKWLEMGGTPLAQKICPKVSVLIPVFKPDIESFKQCIDSLIYQYNNNGQRFSNFEIIIVSEPFCQQEISSFIDSYNDPRIRLVFNEKRLGIAASLNKAMRLAIGQYIARIDDDDIANDHRLIKQIVYLDTHENIVLCTTDFNYFGDMNQKRISFGGEMSRAWSIFTCPFDHPTIMYRKQFFLDNDLFYDETRGYVEDWELWLRAFDKGMTVGCIHEVLFYHRWRNGSAGQANKTIDMMRDLVQNNFRKLGVEISKEDLAFVGPWNGKTSESESERLQDLFDQALKNNAIRKLYDQKSLLKTFSLRVKEAKTGVLPEIWMPLTVGENPSQQYEEWKPEQPGLFKRALKRLLKSFYQPIRHRFEDRIINIERMTSEIQGSLRDVQPMISVLKGQQDELAYSIQELRWALEANKLDMQGTLQERIRETGLEITALDETVSDLTKCQLDTNQKLNQFADGAAKHGKTLEFWNSYRLTSCFLERKIFLIGTPDHDNIGDAAIAAGTYEFIKRYFGDYKLVDITGYQIDRKYSMIQASISDDDLIFLQGGGNLGSMYLLEENIRRRVISDFPNNKIVILPQTIFFDVTDEGRRELDVSSQIYNRHKNLALFTRGKQSLSFAQKHFQNVKSINAVDMALMLDRDFSFVRKGILLCIRDLIDESGLDTNAYEEIHHIVEKHDKNYDKSQNRYSGEIPESLRGMVVNEELKRFAQHKIVVTDRLHGLIFSVITHTPCVVIGSYTQKVKEFSEFFEDSNAVFFIDKDIDRLEETVNKALCVEKAVYPIIKKHPFDEIYRIITECSGTIE